jgi:hypothetical protein
MYTEENRYAGTDTAQRNTFMNDTINEISDIKQILYGIAERLNAAGFYPSPRSAPDSPDKPAENNIRSALTNELARVRETVSSIREQVERLV